ncbi:MAG TPA: dihydroorotase [Bacteroidales bacterium]|nr:dihydroorotase [Bacteroidales bacterium]
MMIIKNINIVDSQQNIRCDIRVENGLIAEVGEHIQGTPCLDFASHDYYLVPAFTDLHAHFRDPGFTYKEDVVSGSRAAVRGGYTAVNLMPNTQPVCSNLSIKSDVEKRVEATGLVFANQTLSMTKDLAGCDISHLRALAPQQVLFVSDDGKGVADDEVMAEIFQICKEKQIVIMSHAEDSRYSKTDMRQAENSMTFRDLELCKKYGARLHFCHVSTIEAITAIAEAKLQGVPVTCEVTPHHLSVTSVQGNHYKVNPPLRDSRDVEALIAAIQNGVVDAIATDHAPHTTDDKNNGAAGISGIETAFALCYTHLVKTGAITLSQLIRLMSETPSQMMNLNKGKIQVGKMADFAVVELNTPYHIHADSFFSKGKNTPFNGWSVLGQVIYTIKEGKIVYGR